MEKEINAIREKLPTEELLAQLAEECMELGHAALKLRRALSGGNPTPVSVNDALEDVIEEIADVGLVIKVLKYDQCEPTYHGIMYRKIRRWESRLEEQDAKVH